MAEGTVSITVDGLTREVAAGSRLIDAVGEFGTFIPRFCYDPRLDPVGMCRMCLVEMEFPRGMTLVPACTTIVNEGMVIDTTSDVVDTAQEAVLEFLLVNHPLDCPICDKGGECPLQDQAFSYGPGESRFVEPKRTYEKPIAISDLILLDRERCIQCALCTRFSDEISGDALIEFKDRADQVEVATFPGEPYGSYFSGNTVQLCPVGALTAEPYRFKARPWDLQTIESVSLVDSVNARVSLQASRGEIVRIYGADSPHTSQGWLSDKDRFIYGHVTSPDRIELPLIKEEDGFRRASWDEAIERVADRLAEFRGDEVAGLGGARGTNEDAYALGKFLRTVVVTPHVDAQLDDGLGGPFAVGVSPRAVIDDLDAADTILAWGADLKEEFPTLYLRVRRAVTKHGATLIVVHPTSTGLDEVAAHKITYRVGSGPETLTDLAAGRKKGFKEARAALRESPVVALLGRTGLAEHPMLAESVAAFVRDLPDATILPLVRRGNVFGALDMGLDPSLLPGRVAITDEADRSALEERWGPLPHEPGLSATGILEGLIGGSLRALLLAGVDPVRDHPSPGLALDALDAAEFVVAFDLFVTDSSRHADIILPAAGLGEVEGTATNLEGRVQKVNPITLPRGEARPVWAILNDLARALGADLGASSAAKVGREIADTAPAYRGVTWDRLLLPGNDGVVVPDGAGTKLLRYIPVDTGIGGSDAALTLHTARSLYDDGVMIRHSPAIAGFRGAAPVAMHPNDAAALGVTEGDSVVVGVDGEAELTVTLDTELAEGTVAVPINQPETAMLGAVGAVTIETGQR